MFINYINLGLKNYIIKTYSYLKDETEQNNCFFFADISYIIIKNNN